MSCHPERSERPVVLSTHDSRSFPFGYAKDQDDKSLWCDDKSLVGLVANVI